MFTFLMAFIFHFD